MDHVWLRNGAWGYTCINCHLVTGKKHDELPKSVCERRSA